MDKQTMTVQLFRGEAGNIVDFWPEQIVFELGVSGNQELSDRCNIFSVHIANDQCSRFLKSIHVHETERFKGADTTTNAASIFQSVAEAGDGLLCSRSLLASNGLDSKRDCTNPFNFTLFSAINALPMPREYGDHMYSLACVIVDLNNDKLPYDFIKYWQQLFSEQDAEAATNVLDEMPKILFIIRFQEAKALLLLEMVSRNPSESPWPIPDIDDPGLEVRNEIFSIEQVGAIHESYVATERALFISRFIEHGHETAVIFYGLEESFMWGAPALNVFVHGYDFKLVKECARLQIKRLASLADYGIPVPATASELLDRYDADQRSMRLSTDSLPAQA
jgi:hypothetical protein